MRKLKRRMAVKIERRVRLDYLLYLPEKRVSSSGKPPLLLFLHGAGERGSRLDLVKKHGPPREIERGAELPFVVVAPQCPAGGWWQSDSLMALLDHIIERHDADPSRIYLTGLSMGGNGTWALANACPDRFAAIAPICGPFEFIDPKKLKRIPVWCFHGALDNAVPVDHSVRMVRMLREAGVNVRFTVYPDAGHDSWTVPYGGTELYDWLLTHRKRISA